MKVQCLNCMQLVEVPKLKELEYTKWPVMHKQCVKAKKEEVLDKKYNDSIS